MGLAPGRGIGRRVVAEPFRDALGRDVAGAEARLWLRLGNRLSKSGECSRRRPTSTFAGARKSK
ncbi:MAG: hypothetical protein NVS2B4_14930 [Ramlibacter sp.]